MSETGDDAGETETGTEIGAAAEPGAEAATETEAEIEAETEPGSSAQTETETETEAETETSIETDPKTETRPEPRRPPPPSPKLGAAARIMRALRSPRLLAALLGLLTIVMLLRAEAQVGYVRDEGVYFEASRHYAAWVVRRLHDGREVNTAEIRDRYFGINHEHPALMKLAAGLSARLFAEPPDPAYVAEIDETRGKRKRAWRRELAAVEGGKFHWMREGAAMRLPAILLTGLAVFLLFTTGRRLGGGTLAGLLAVGSFILLPRVAFHAGLHAFDVPIAVMTLILALAWLRALSDWRWGLAMGPLLGIAIAVKHNALFLGPLLTLHLWVMLGLRWRHEDQRPQLRQLIPLPVVSMAVLGPLVALMLWPWMWDDTIARLGEYFEFHRQHSYYNMEFWGRNFNRPPLPIAYPFVMTWATVPSGILLLAGVGVLLVLRTIRVPRALRHLGRFGDNRKRAQLLRVGARARGREGGEQPEPRWSSPLPTFDGREEPLLHLGLASFPLVLIALPSVPIFGGTKHWLTAYPFMALLAAMAWGRLWWRARTLLRAWPKLLRTAPPIVLIAVLTPGAWATVHGHPYNLSQYAPLAGGARGAAGHGLNRGFWGHAVVPLLRDGGLEGQRVFVHDVHRLAVEQYRREGRWPTGTVVAGLGRADTALLFPEKHMLSEEIAIWDSLGTVRPSMVLTLDDVPVTIVYQRPDWTPN